MFRSLKTTLMLGALAVSINLATANTPADASIDKGAAFLIGKQKANGSWGDHPAITGLCVMGIANTKAGTTAAREAAIDKGLLDIKAGRVKSHKEAKKMYAKWL